MKTVKMLSICTTLLFTSAAAFADYISVTSNKSVSDTADALVEAVEGAGANVFARVDHQAGAASLDLELSEAELVIFGNPAVGTPAMQDDIRAGVVLPLRVLVYADGAGQTHLLYEEPDDMFDDMNIDDDADYIQKITGALAALTSKAAE